MLFIVTRQNEGSGADFYLVAAASPDEARQLFDGADIDLNPCVESVLFEQYDGIALLGTA